MASKVSDVDSYNRIFIIGAKDVSSEEVKETFSLYGRVTDVYFPIDKATREKKGVLYVTFNKASEAALAIEKMNGRNIFNCRSLKVVLASSRKDGNIRDPDEDSKMLRLFIVIPPGYRERDIEDEFQKFGKVVSVHIVKDKKTSEGRGLAFVKFERAYDAAIALENCDSQFKPMFAETPRSRSDHRFEHRSDRSNHYDRGDAGDPRKPNFSQFPRSLAPDVSSLHSISSRGLTEAAFGTLDALRSYASAGPSQTILEAVFPPACLGYEQVSKFFDLVPGLESCNYDPNSGRAFVKYSTPQAAAYAQDKMDNFEYPLGCHIIVRYAKDPYSSGMYGSSPVDNPLNNVHTLVESIQKATVLLQQAGIGVGGPVIGGRGQGQSYGGDRQSLNYSDIVLPERRPLAPHDAPIVERLFIVSNPDVFDDKILEDVFCRFGNMIGAYFMPGKKFGYVKFASRQSAQQAMDVLHGQTICGNRLKVLPAEPMRRKTDDSSKREHSTGDSSMRDDDDISAPRGKHSRYD